MDSELYDFGMIGLGTMGCNLLLNMADNHFAVVGFDINRAKAEEFEASANPNTTVKGVFELSAMVQQLKIRAHSDGNTTRTPPSSLRLRPNMTL